LDKLKNPNLSESEQAQAHQRIALIFIESGNVEEYKNRFKQIGLKSLTPDLQCELHTACLRAAIALHDKQLFYE